MARTLRGVKEDGEEMLTITETAAELDVSRAFIYTLIKRGDLTPQINPYKKSHSMKIPRSQLDAFKRRARGD